VSEQRALGRRAERRPAAELPHAPDVVEQRRREQEVAPQPRMQLRRLAAERGDADRVLEQTARVAVVALGPGRGKAAHAAADLVVGEHAADECREPGMGDLRGEELEEPVELVRVAAHRRGEVGRVRFGRLDRAHLQLQPSVEALDAREHAHGVALREAPVEELDVVPDATLDPPARVDELEREVRLAVLRRQATLARDREDRSGRASRL